jgi:hypothetical protein
METAQLSTAVQDTLKEVVHSPETLPEAEQL